MTAAKKVADAESLVAVNRGRIADALRMVADAITMLPAAGEADLTHVEGRYWIDQTRASLADAQVILALLERSE